MTAPSIQASFNASTYNITALLGRNSFPNGMARPVAVPQFQRNYSWEKSHVATFWEDLDAFRLASAKKSGPDSYFLGPIVILPEQAIVSVLDGQQRLATATIALAAIRDIARAVGGQPGADLARDIQRDLIMLDADEDERALRLGELDDPFFRAWVQEDPPTRGVKPTLRSHRLIRQAQVFLDKAIRGTIDGLPTGKKVAALKGTARTLSSMVKLVTIEVQSEEEAFLIFETLNDRGLRLAVPDLVLNHLMRVSATGAEREQVRRSWNDVVENLGQRQVSTYIRHMWISRYGDVKSQGLFREIRDSLAKGNVPAVHFADLCADESAQYAALWNADVSVIGSTAAPLVSALLEDLTSDRSLPLLLAGITSLSQGDFAKLTKATVATVTRHSVFTNQNPLSLESALYRAARALRQAKESGSASSKCLAAAKAELQGVNPKDSDLNEAVYLSQKEARFILYALAEAAQSKGHGVKIGANSIEHIFPENAEAGEWPDHAALEPFVWHLGNLAVLEPSLNRDAGRRAYSEKVTYYAKSEITDTHALPTTYPSWDVFAIETRAKRLLKAAKALWPEKI